MASLSKLDAVYRSILMSKFFTKGWGKSENLKRLFAFRKIISNRESCRHLVSPDHPIIIDKIENHPHYQTLDGHFVSPFVHHMPEVVPEESHIARFQMIIPKQWPSLPHRPVCLHLAGTGDHFYWKRRMFMAKPLLKESGIASILLENPFYGSRKPKSQVRSNLHNVSDIIVMGGCLMLESLALFHWCEREGFGPVGISGISMGGHMASLAGCSWHKPLPIIPCLSWSTASCVFTQGVMSGAIPWPVLQNQYRSDNVYQDEIRQMFHSPEQSDAFYAGVHFSRTFPSSMEHMQKLASVQENECSSSNIELELNSNSPNNETLSSSSIPVMPNRDNSLHKAVSLKMNSSTFRTSELKISDRKLHSKSEREKLKFETIDFMRGIMDECTHLGNFTPPVDPSLCIVVTAKHDAYVPRDGIQSIAELWPGCDIRYIDSGHIAAFLFNHDVFRKAVTDAFNKCMNKYGNNILTEETKVVLERDATS